MSKVRLFTITAAFATLALFSTSSAQAGDCGCSYSGHGFGLLNAYGGSGTLYGLGLVPIPPYFSLHPPVYYGYRVARPYGYSPYAAPAGVLPAEFVQAPKLIDNPFLVGSQREAAPAAAPGTVAGGPRLIENPFYRPAGDDGKIAAATH